MGKLCLLIDISYILSLNIDRILNVEILNVQYAVPLAMPRGQNTWYG